MTSSFFRACLAAIVIAVCAPLAALAQTPAVAKLVITVVDPTGAVLPNATVTLVGTEAATKAATLDPAKSDDKGQATIDRLVPGRYTIKGEFPGFAAAELKDQRLRAGDNKHVLILPLKRMEDSVTVGRDAREAASDRTLTFGSALTREQIQALSDDPDEMRRQLMELAGPDAVIRVDSFEGQQLPPKAQIKSIRISRDQFAAENHGAFHGIDIITQPGVGPLRTSVRMGFYDSRLDGVNPLVAARGPGQDRNFGGTLGGTLIKDRMDFSISFNGSNNWLTPQLYASTSGGTLAQNLAIKQPRVNNGVSGLLNYALTKDQTLRIGFNANEGNQKNLGIGDRDFIERAYSTDNRGWGFRLQESGPLGRRFVTNTRLMVNRSKSVNRSAFEGSTIVVQDSFTSGGAQRRGGARSSSFVFQQDFDYVRGLHSLRAGLMLDGGHFRNDSSTNYFGTYTFESLEKFQAGQPRSYTRRIGDPTIDYWNVQTGLYIQDDYRPRKNLSFSYGLRYEGQLRVKDRLNLGPRFGFTWSPLASGRMSVRSSWGIFYDWFNMGTYAQTLQTDGTRQSEVNIINPTFPDPGVVTGSLPTNRYLLGEHTQLPRNQRFSAGLSGSIKRLSIGGTYYYMRGKGLLVGENLNAPVNGVRPDSTLANVIRAVAEGESRTHNINGNIGISLSPTGPQAAALNQKRFSWRRGLSVYNYFGVNIYRNNTDGAFAVPASGDLSQEWGNFGSKWNTNLSVSSGMLKNLNVNLSMYVSGPSPFTIRTGFDDNGDLIFNDRPAGVGRNTAYGTRQVGSDAYISYTIGFGRQTTSAPQGIMIMERGGAMTAAPMQANAAPRYRLNINVSINNPTNRANYSGYSGVMTSRFFLQPTSASGVRRIRFGASLSF